MPFVQLYIEMSIVTYKENILFKYKTENIIILQSPSGTRTAPAQN